MELPDGDWRAEMSIRDPDEPHPHQDLLARTTNRAGKRASIARLRRGLPRKPVNGHRHEQGRTTRAPRQELYRHSRTAGGSGTNLLCARTELCDTWIAQQVTGRGVVPINLAISGQSRLIINLLACAIMITTWYRAKLIAQTRAHLPCASREPRHTALRSRTNT